MQFFNDVPWTLFDTIGPPTKAQPQWSGRGYKRFVFNSNPVQHVVDHDGSHSQMIQVHAEEAHLPVEHELNSYMKETGYNASAFFLPAGQTHTDNYGTAQYDNPDSRPGSDAILPPPPGRAKAALQSVNPARGPNPPSHPVRDPSESTLPYHPVLGQGRF